MPTNNYHIDLDHAILRTLLYFDIFGYPLKAVEILNFLPVKADSRHLQLTLDALAFENQITCVDDLYAVQPETDVFTRRLKGNALADALLPTVEKQAEVISRFPFVRAVMASGSFSKNFMDKNSDFDFFIVCAPQRVWVSRMLLVLYKKLFLKNSHRHFCVNYFVDENHLEIDEKNIFTATELATVLPLTGSAGYKRLMAANEKWLKNYFPNYLERIPPDEKHEPLAKRIVEKCIDWTIGDSLNRIFKNITLHRWKKMYGNSYSPEDFSLAFKSTDHVSKNHPRNFQKRVLDEFQFRIDKATKRAEVL
ncbi:MAG TPA: hypothetical protein VGD40_09310 [Chryseosolibacter sp.]